MLKMDLSTQQEQRNTFYSSGGICYILVFTTTILSVRKVALESNWISAAESSSKDLFS